MGDVGLGWIDDGVDDVDLSGFRGVDLGLFIGLAAKLQLGQIKDVVLGLVSSSVFGLHLENCQVSCSGHEEHDINLVACALGLAQEVLSRSAPPCWS